MLSPPATHHRHQYGPWSVPGAPRWEGDTRLVHVTKATVRFGKHRRGVGSIRKPVSLKHWKGRRGRGGGSKGEGVVQGGGCNPPPTVPTVVSHSNTSLPRSADGVRERIRETLNLRVPAPCGGGGGRAIGQVWTRYCRSSRACPTAFIALSVHHVFVRPMALFVFQTVPCPCPPGWGQSCGPRVLGFTAWAHCTRDTESGSWRLCGVPYLGVRYLGCACLRWPLLATHRFGGGGAPPMQVPCFPLDAPTRAHTPPASTCARRREVLEGGGPRSVCTKNGPTRCSLL